MSEKRLENFWQRTFSQSDTAKRVPRYAGQRPPPRVLATAGLHYFDWHHTNADTFDKIVPREFQLNVASLAVLTYVLADMPERLSDLK